MHSTTLTLKSAIDKHLLAVCNESITRLWDTMHRANIVSPGHSNYINQASKNNLWEIASESFHLYCSRTWWRVWCSANEFIYCNLLCSLNIMYIYIFFTIVQYWFSIEGMDIALKLFHICQQLFSSTEWPHIHFTNSFILQFIWWHRYH